MEIVDHMLKGPNVKFKKTPNVSGTFAAGLPDTVVVHYTAGPYDPSLNTLINPKVKASAHLLVDRDGSVTQLAPFNMITWHAGASEWKGRTGLNSYSIGIEIVNAGPLTKSGDVFRAWYGAAFNPSEVIEATHRNESSPRYWHVYTEEQIRVVSDICQELIDTYGVKEIVGHEEIAPKRKADPGPAFPLDRMRNKLLSGNRDDNNGIVMAKNGKVIASKLNIRATPSTEGEKVAAPLTLNKKVKILEQNGEWYKVSVEIEGWVAAKFIGLE